MFINVHVDFFKSTQSNWSPNITLGVFMGLGLSGIVPTMHFTIEEGFVKATTVGQMGWFYLMGAMYITGAGLYAARIPERYFPGKCDIWVSICIIPYQEFQSAG